MVYIYESCLPVATFATQNTQIVQTEQVGIANIPGTIFKDSNNICWTYLGEFDNSYITPTNKFYLTYEGNFFEKERLLPPVYYPDCQTCYLTQVSACTEIYFGAERCDNGESIVVKVCDVGPITGNLKLTPTVGDVCGIINPNGDDFCVTLMSQVSAMDTEYGVITPAWNTYDCNSCPIYRVYSVNSIDGLIEDMVVNDSISSEILEEGKIVNLNVDGNCFIINYYMGIKANYLYNPNTTPTINEVFDTTQSCVSKFYTQNNYIYGS